MRIKEIRLNHFGKFHNKTIQLKDGINLIYGDNEAGKSTIHSFIKGMLFGIEKLRGRASKEDMYVKYQPWDTPGAYQGSMDIEVEGKTYRIHRNFEKNTKNCTVTNMETGRELSLQPEELMALYGGLTEAGYRNTISIEQLKSRTDQELVEEVRNFITNLSMSKSNEVDVTKALNFLQDKRKQLEAQQVSTKLHALEEEIEAGIACEMKIDKLTLQLKEMETQLTILQRKSQMSENASEIVEGFTSMEAYNNYLTRFPAICEKYESYCENQKQYNLLLEKQSALQDQYHEAKSAQEDNANLKEEIAKLESIRTRLFEIEENKKNLSIKHEKSIQQGKNKKLLYSIIPVILGVLGFTSFYKKSYPLLGLSGLFIFLGIILFIYLTYLMSRKQTLFVQEQDGYEKERMKYQTQESDILYRYNAIGDPALKKKQEEVLRRELFLEHADKQFQDYEEQLTTMNNRIVHLRQEILDYINQSSTKVKLLNDSVMKSFEEEIQRQKQNIAKHHEMVAMEYENCKIQKEKIKWELLSLEGNEETLLKNQELHKELLLQRDENEQELSAIKLAIETINQLSVDIHDSFGSELNLLISNLASEVTAGKYTDIKVDEKLNVKVGYKDNYVMLDKLSSGTIGQLYFSLRMAIADLVYGKGTMPILLDDCFAFYDDKRTKAAIETIAKGQEGQVLLFTCHTREKAMLEQMKLEFNYIDLSHDMSYENNSQF